MTEKAKFWIKHGLMFIGVAFLVGLLDHLIVSIEIHKTGQNYAYFYLVLIWVLWMLYSVLEGAWSATGKIEGVKESRQSPYRMLLFLTEMLILLWIGHRSVDNLIMTRGYLWKVISYYVEFTFYYGTSWWVAKRYNKNWLGIVVGILASILIQIAVLFWGRFLFPPLLLAYFILAGFVGILYMAFTTTRIKLLFWKELRETWWAFAIALIVPFLMAMVAGLDTAYFLSSASLGFLLAGFLGGRSFASETENHTLEFISTRPLHPRTLFLVKYFTGAGLIMLMDILLVSSVNFSKTLYQATLIEIIISILISATPLLIFYSVCLTFSFLFRDSLRSSLFGFGATAVIFMGLATIFYEVPIWLYYFQKDIQLGNIFLVKTTFYFLMMMSLVMGITGSIYYCWLKKKFDWKNGFALLVPAALLLTFLFNSIYFGNMRPDIHQSTVPFRINNQENAHLWGNKLYYQDYEIYGRGIRITCIDFSDPRHIRNSILRYPLPDISWRSAYDRNYLYDINTVGRINPGELVQYDLSQETTIREVRRVKLPAIPPTPLSLQKTAGWGAQLYTDSTAIFAEIYQPFEVIYLDKHRNPIKDRKPVKYSDSFISKKIWCAVLDKESLKTIELFPVLPSMDLSVKLQGIGYQQYSFAVETPYPDTYLSLYEMSNWKYPKLIKRIIKLDTLSFYNSRQSDIKKLMVIQGNNLYVSVNKNLLEVYDISRLPEIHKISQISLGYADRQLDSMGYLYLNRTLIVEGPNAFVINPRGVYWIDVSNPAKPKIKGRDNSIETRLPVVYIEKKLFVWNVQGLDIHLYDFNRGEDK